ncbi:hypothetical protein ACT7DJ_28505 [Bacillus cereus]|uniref:hypothetical protein n=1 Tax=Bacillus thuringiensis TaxID=1428 RepID=UPI0015964EDD|nr:hypothetical protein [Bacillus thuringiensis]
MIVEVVGELNCKLFAEKFVEIARRKMLNGEIDFKKYKEYSKAEDSCNDKG